MEQSIYQTKRTNGSERFLHVPASPLEMGSFRTSPMWLRLTFPLFSLLSSFFLAFFFPFILFFLGSAFSFLSKMTATTLAFGNFPFTIILQSNREGQTVQTFFFLLMNSTGNFKKWWQSWISFFFLLWLNLQVIWCAASWPSCLAKWASNLFREIYVLMSICTCIYTFAWTHQL